MATASSQAPHRPARTSREDTGPVAVKGTLIVKWIAGRNGEFAVGDLRTPIGEFRVKDALLDQFDEGEYQGIFWISQIYAKSYEYRGRITIETRASIAENWKTRGRIVRALALSQAAPLSRIVV